MFDWIFQNSFQNLKNLKHPSKVELSFLYWPKSWYLFLSLYLSVSFSLSLYIYVFIFKPSKDALISGDSYRETWTNPNVSWGTDFPPSPPSTRSSKHYTYRVNLPRIKEREIENILLNTVYICREIARARLKVHFIQKHVRGFNRAPARVCIIARLNPLRDRCHN